MCFLVNQSLSIKELNNDVPTLLLGEQIMFYVEKKKGFTAAMGGRNREISTERQKQKKDFKMLKK